MTVTIDLGQIITLTASVIAIVGGLYGFLHWVKKWWNGPPS